MFEPYGGGHRGQYLKYLIDYWARIGWPTKLQLAVFDDQLEVEPEFAEAVQKPGTDDLEIISLYRYLDPTFAGGGLVKNNLAQGRCLAKIITAVRPDRCLLMYLDHLLIPLGMGLRFDYPVKVAGIYFRPTIGYPVTSARSVVTSFRKRQLMKFAARNRHLSSVLSLDPYAVRWLRSLGDVAAHALPDPVEFFQTRVSKADMLKDLGIASHKRVLLSFGSQTKRKGVHKILEAIDFLSEETLSKIAFLFVGPIDINYAGHLIPEIEKRRERAEIVVVDKFVADREIGDYFGASDIALLPYQDHVGSSNVLIRAAGAGLPVIASDWGLVGKWTRDYKLGYAIDSSNPNEIAKVIQSAIHSIDIKLFDRNTAIEFASHHTVAAWGDLIAATILS